jgi:predicted AAA+ superfamily ATPase
MVDLLLVRRLQPYTFNIGKRLVKSPKVYVRDSGITHALLNIENYNELLSHPVIGGSWEGFVIENIMAIAPTNVNSYFYRTAEGAEIDLVLEFGITERWAIEIKRNSAPAISKGFYIACEDIQATRKFVVYSGQETFKIKNDISVISLIDLMNEIIENG